MVASRNNDELFNEEIVEAVDLYDLYFNNRDLKLKTMEEKDG